jgi:lysyl-tRNA synthetase class 2
MLDEQSNLRLEKLKKLEELGVEVYPYSFEKSHDFKELINQFKDSSNQELEAAGIVVKIAGRVIAVRKMGKSAFLHLFDGEAKLQIYIRKDIISEKISRFLNYWILVILLVQKANCSVPKPMS